MLIFVASKYQIVSHVLLYSSFCIAEIPVLFTCDLCVTTKPDFETTTNEASFCIVCCTDKGQATLSLGMDLNLDWMTLDDFQKHLNGEDEILSGPPLSPSEYFHSCFRQ